MAPDPDSDARFQGEMPSGFFLKGERIARRVLVVEDQPEIARALARYLSMAGYQVVTTSSTREAQSLREAPFDVGIFDVEIGQGDGIELAERLLEKGRVECAVFFSAVSDLQTIGRAASLGTFIDKARGLAKVLDVVAARFDEHDPVTEITD